MSATGRNPGHGPSPPAAGRDRLAKDLGQEGFTLFEMLVTVAILALISGIAFPRLQVALSRQTLTETRSAVALALARARSEAIRGDMPTRISLTERGDALEISRIAATALPANAIVEWPRDGVVVYGDGSSSGASGAVRAGTAVARFAIDRATARLEFAP